MLLHLASQDSLRKRVTESFLEASKKGTKAAPKAKCREVEGPQGDKAYQHDAVCSRTVACTPGLRNPRAFILPVLNKAVKIAHLHAFH